LQLIDSDQTAPGNATLSNHLNPIRSQSRLIPLNGNRPPGTDLSSNNHGMHQIDSCRPR
jgi:hypothetical protein